MKMTMAQAFDEWMRKYKEDPDGFCNGMQSARAHDKPSDDPGVSEYGKDCAALLEALMTSGGEAWEPTKVETTVEQTGDGTARMVREPVG